MSFFYIAEAAGKKNGWELVRTFSQYNKAVYKIKPNEYCYHTVVSHSKSLVWGNYGYTTVFDAVHDLKQREGSK